MKLISEPHCENYSSGEISVVLMSTLMALDEDGLAGYSLDETSETFLTSEVGIAIWAEHDGSYHKLEGKSQAKLIQTPLGPVVEIYKSSDGAMEPQFRIRCVDILGMGPAIPSRILQYRDLLSFARVNRVMH